MKAHKGMRPQDIVILLYLIDLNTTDWKVSDVAKELNISQSEVSEALQRCQLAKQLDKKNKKVLRCQALAISLQKKLNNQ